MQLVQRLQSRAQFQAVLAAPTVVRTPHFAMHRLSIADNALDAATPAFQLGAMDSLWLGAMAPKRWARRAVTRNTVKRQIYAVAAEFAASLPNAAYVVRLRSGFDTRVYVSAKSETLRLALRSELLHLFAKATGLSSSSTTALNTCKNC